MIEVLSRHEDAPDAWPAVSGVDSDALAWAWPRIEAWIAWRFCARDVTWRVDGSGEWQPDLRPLDVVAAKAWIGNAWDSVTLTPAPDGYYLPHGRYEITATAGDGVSVPDDVAEAVRRLVAYHTGLAAIPAGARGYSASIDIQSESFRFDDRAAARAIHNSGAADLLRPYRTGRAGNAVAIQAQD